MLLLNILKKSFRVYQETFLVSLLGSIFLCSIVMGAFLLVFPILFGIPLEQFSQTILQDPEGFQKVALTSDFQVKNGLFRMLMLVFLAPLSAGFYKIFDKSRNGEEIGISVIFSFYNSIYTSRILFFTILLTSVKSVITFLLLKMGLGFADFSISVVLSLLFMLTIPIIVFENESVVNSAGRSARLVIPYMFTIFIALFIAIIFVFLGLVFAIFGVIFTLPFFFAVIYNIYLSTKEICSVHKH